MPELLTPPAFDEAEDAEAPLLPPAFDEAEDAEPPLLPPAFDEAEDAAPPQLASPVVVPPPITPTSSRLADAAARIPSEIAQMAAKTAQGLVKIGSYTPPGLLIRGLEAAQGAITGKPSTRAADTQQFMRDVQERAASDYGVDPLRDKDVVSKVISGAGSLVPILAAGPAAPVAAGGLMAESAQQDAEAHGATPTQQGAAFALGGVTGIVSEFLLGLPALIRSAKAAGLADDATKSLLRPIVSQAFKSAGRESGQEAIEQVTGNLIANTLVGYDPKRENMEGVAEAAAFGAVIGGPVGGVVQAAASIDARRAEPEATVIPGGPVTGAQGDPGPLQPDEVTPAPSEALPAQTLPQETAIAQEVSRSEGPGAAAATEIPPPTKVSIANEKVNERRVREGNLRLLNEERQSNPDTWAQAEALLERDPDLGSRLVDQIRDGTKQSVTHVEEAALIHEAVTVKNRRDLAAERASDQNASEEERLAAAAEWQVAEDRLNEVDQATKVVGTATGRALQIRKMQIADDYTYAGMERKARAAKQGALTAQESATIKAQAERITELEKQLADAETGAPTAAERAHAELEKEARKKGKVAPKDAAGIESGILKGLQARAKAGDQPTDLRSWFQRLALHFIRTGTHGREPVIQKVHDTVKDIFPGLTREQTRDLISGFGDFRPLDLEAAKTELRQIKQEAQQLAKLEKIVTKQPIPKTGPERQTPSDEGRRLIQAVNEAKKKYGVVVTDPASQLKSAQDAISTRLKNQLRDLAAQLETGEKPAGKTPLEYNEENKRLRDLRDRVRETLDAVTERADKPALTPEQRVVVTEKALERLEAHYRDMIRRGEHTKAKTTPVTSAAIEASRARLAELREEIQLMRDLDDGLQAEKATKKNAADIKRTEESITELDRQLREGDVASKAKPSGSVDPKLEQLRSERDALRKYRDELRREALPKKTPEEIALQAYKTRTANRIAELQDKIARGDFAKKMRTPLDVSADPVAVRLQAQVEAEKARFRKALDEYQKSQRTKIQRVLDATRETIEVSKNVVTALDLSAVLRQGGMIVAGNPLRGIRALGPMFQATFSKERANEIAVQIQRRLNYKLYQSAKLHLADVADINLSGKEELIRSEWANRIPLVGASNRAFATFLNVLRADSFDAMLLNRQSGGTPSPEALKAIANYVNVATGRGNFGTGRLAQAPAVLSIPLWSPRLLASRIQIFTGQPLRKASDAQVRKQIAWEYGKTMIGLGSVLSLGVLMGASFEDDPRSSDFGKLRFGDTRVDLLFGLGQVAVLGTRLFTGEKRMSAKGKEEGKLVPIRPKWHPLNAFREQPITKKVPFGSNTFDVGSNFLRTKFSPVFGAGVDALTGTNVIGEEVTLGSLAGGVTTPLALRDVHEVMTAHGVAAGTALTLLGLFGAGVQHYSTEPKTNRRVSE